MSETEGIIGTELLGKWIAEPDGLARVDTHLSQIEVSWGGAECLLSLVRSGLPTIVTRLSPEGATHLAKLLLRAATSVPV